MADHIPAESVGAQGDFGFGFLDLIFAEPGQAELRRGVDDFRRLAFGHRQEGDGAGVASGAGAGRGDPFSNVMQLRL